MSSTNDLRRRDVSRGVPPPTSTPSVSPEGASGSEGPPSQPTGAAETEAAVAERSYPGSNQLWRLLALFASIYSQFLGAFQTVQNAVGRALHHGHTFLSAVLTPRSFAELFEDRYGTTHPPFFQGSLRDAFDEARSTQKPLVVYLDDAGPVAEMACREVLTSSVLIDVLQTHGFLFVGLSPGSPDGAWLERMLRARQLPCLVFFLPNPPLPRNPPKDPQLRWQSLAPRWLHSALQGSWGEEEALEQVIGAVGRYYQDKEECSRKEEEMKQDQILRREQEAAFEEIQRHESLRLSRQREERQMQAERERKQQQEAERQAQRQEQRLKQQELMQRERLAAAAEFRAQDEECSKLSADERTTICLKLPSGFRVTRAFSRRTPLSLLHRWAGCAIEYSQEASQSIPEKFELVVPPKTTLSQEGTLDDAGLHPNCVVLLVEIESEDESEGET